MNWLDFLSRLWWSNVEFRIRKLLYSRDQSAARTSWDYRERGETKQTESLLCGVEGEAGRKKKERKKEQRLREQLLVLTVFFSLLSSWTSVCPLGQQSPVFLVPGTDFCRRQFFRGLGGGRDLGSFKCITFIVHIIFIIITSVPPRIIRHWILEVGDPCFKVTQLSEPWLISITELLAGGAWLGSVS